MNVAKQTQAEQIIEALNIFVGPGNVAEIRALGVHGRKGRTDAGYFDDFEMAAHAVLSIQDAKGIYFVLNAVNPDLLARAANRIKQFAQLTTSDRDIIRRRWLLIDCDPVRPSGISSSDTELDAALARANEVTDWMMTKGFNEPILARSGNGAHVHVPIDMPNDDDATETVKSILEATAERFSDESVEIDTTVFNAARICRLYGTTACKGDSIPSRPHRLSELLHVPDYLNGGINHGA